MMESSLGPAPIKKHIDSRGILPALLSCFLFFVIGLYVLFYGHPHEDAYILYIYAENLSEFGKITYFEDGPPAEGATDFLWVILIAIMHSVGINSALAALILNTFGVFLFTFILLCMAQEYEASPYIRALIAASTPFYIIAQAAYAGFSVSLYSALLAMLFYLSLKTTAARVALIPVLGLAISLFRPDGVIIAVGVIVVLLFFVRGSELRLLIISATACGVAGIIYFIWRWSYFGYFLPLPLIVKGHSDFLLPGIYNNMRWLKNNAPLIILGVSSLFFLGASRKRFAMLTIPFWVYFIVLGFVVQSQNVGYRFQAPLAVVLLIGLVIFSANIFKKDFISGKLAKWKMARNKMRLLITFSVILLAIFSITRIDRTISQIDDLTTEHYINQFPYLLSLHAPDDTVTVLTEAGRFAYWMPGEIYDLVGLNTAQTAVEGASVEYINSLSPDIVFFHHADILGDLSCENDENFCMITSNEIRQSMQRSETPTWRNIKGTRVTGAPLRATEFILQNPHSYSVYAVWYWGQYRHIYAIKNDGKISREVFLSALESAFSDNARLSYFDLLLQKSWKL